MDNNNKDFFLDGRYVKEIISKEKKTTQKYKSLSVKLTVAIVALLVITLISSLFALNKISKYELYLTQTIDSTIDSIIGENLSTKYLLDEVSKGNTSTSNLVSLSNNLEMSKKSYSNIKDILFVAMDTVSPDKMVTATDKLNTLVKNILNNNLGKDNVVLSASDIAVFTQYNQLYNDILLFNYNLVNPEDKETTENNFSLFNVDSSSLASLEISYKENYTQGVIFTIDNTEWIDVLAKIQNSVLKYKI